MTFESSVSTSGARQPDSSIWAARCRSVGGCVSTFDLVRSGFLVLSAHVALPSAADYYGDHGRRMKEMFTVAT